MHPSIPIVDPPKIERLIPLKRELKDYDDEDEVKRALELARKIVALSEKRIEP